MILSSGLSKLPKSGNVGVKSGIYNEKKSQIQSDAMKKIAGLSDPNSEFQKSYANREANLAQKYAETRRGLDASKQAMGSDLTRALQRQQAAGGGAGGGAMAKLRTQGISELAKQYGSIDAGLGAEEAAAKEGLAGQKASEQFAREEAIRSGQQFSETMAFQEGSFADQMRYTWAELDENKKTNLINAAALLKDSGLDSEEARSALFDALSSIYGTRSPNWASPSYSTSRTTGYSNPSQTSFYNR